MEELQEASSSMRFSRFIRREGHSQCLYLPCVTTCLSSRLGGHFSRQVSLCSPPHGETVATGRRRLNGGPRWWGYMRTSRVHWRRTDLGARALLCCRRNQWSGGGCIFLQRCWLQGMGEEPAMKVGEKGVRLRTWHEGREGKLEGRFFCCYGSSDNKSDSLKKRRGVIKEKTCIVSWNRKKTQTAGDLHSLLR